jgi:hypothetical protein
MASITVPEFNSTAVDLLTENLSRIEGLASCCASLAQAEADGVLRHILIDKALPELAMAMQRLAQDSQAATETLWKQCSELRSALEASHG